MHLKDRKVCVVCAPLKLYSNLFIKMYNIHVSGGKSHIKGEKDNGTTSATMKSTVYIAFFL